MMPSVFPVFFEAEGAGDVCFSVTVSHTMIQSKTGIEDRIVQLGWQKPYHVLSIAHCVVNHN